MNQRLWLEIALDRRGFESNRRAQMAGMEPPVGNK